MRLVNRRYPRAAVIVAIAIGFASAGGGEARADKAACFDTAEQAQLSRYQHDLLGARAQLMACARSDCPPTVARDCTQWLGEVTQALPSLAIHARDSRGRDVIGVAVLIDGHPEATQLGGTAVSLNPGAHTVRLETRAGAIYEEKILAIEGQKDRVLDVQFAVPLDQDGKRARATELPPSPAGSARHGYAADGVALGFAALGVAGVALATYFEVAGQNEHGSLENGCGVARTCSSSDVDSSKEKLYVGAPVALGVGLLSLGAAVGVYLLGNRSAPPSARAAWRLGITPLAGGGAMGGAARSF